jgi:hypothetical protein
MNGTRLVCGRSPHRGAVIALAALTLVVPAGLAQTPESGAEAAHPVHIHAGTCAELGEVVVPLADVIIPAGEQRGSPTAINSSVSLNVIDMPFEALLAGAYAVNVHASAEEIDTYIACGDIGGVIEQGDDGDEIRFVLTELNGSGHTGVAFIGGAGEGQTQVNVMMIEPEEMG